MSAKLVLVGARDLVMTAKVREIATAGGGEVKVFRKLEDGIKLLEEHGNGSYDIKLVLVDLTEQSLDPQALASALSQAADPKPALYLFYPHVREDLVQAPAPNGAKYITRGKLFSVLPELLSTA